MQIRAQNDLFNFKILFFKVKKTLRLTLVQKTEFSLGSSSKIRRALEKLKFSDWSPSFYQIISSHNLCIKSTLTYSKFDYGYVKAKHGKAKKVHNKAQKVFD